MNATSKTHWQWTSVAEQKWQQHEVEPRRAGQMLTVLDDKGYRVKRIKVPRSWVEKGYVEECEGEQVDLFDL